MFNRWILGILLISVGFLLSLGKGRPFIDYNFHFIWFGFLLITDRIAFYLTKKTIFSNWRDFLVLAFASSFFWWFYEWANLSLKNWAYPTKPLYDSVEWGIFATAAFTTVIPHLMISTNTISTLVKNKTINFLQGNLNKQLAFVFILLGFVCLVFITYIPLYTFPLIWLVFFLILDPINALSGRRSLTVQLFKKNFIPIFVLIGAGIYAGFWWETINFIIPKWIYPIVPWFWDLPAPITTKYAQMPLAGFLGYIPFIFSAFAFVEFLDLKIKFLNKNEE